MGAGHARNRYFNRKERDAEGMASDWSEVVTRYPYWKVRSFTSRVRYLVQVLDGPVAPEKRIEEASDYFMYAPLGSGGHNSVGRALLLQLGHCDYGLDNQSVDLRGGGLPCGGCQRFESAYLQLLNLADTKLCNSTQFFRFGGSIYDLSFMDVDKIHPFSSTLGWHSLKSEGRGSKEERLTVDT
ncbi:hypothetical protein FXO37_34414 [Capsicum annuum]|nr:hypothetical protein FXO37_34414 [Capsicum annuum]